MFEQENEAYHYPKNTNGSKTGTTLCVLVRDGRIFVGEATLSPEDQFVKKLGRKIAKGRAEKSYASYLAKKQRRESKNKSYSFVEEDQS